jgi:hypothetical protein
VRFERRVLNICLLSLSCPSLCLYVTIKEIVNGFSWNFTKICLYVPSLNKSGNTGYLWKQQLFTVWTKWNTLCEKVSSFLKRQGRWYISLPLLKYTVTCRFIPRQRMKYVHATIGKVLQELFSIWSAPCPLLDNGSLNIFPRKQRRGTIDLLLEQGRD